MSLPTPTPTFDMSFTEDQQALRKTARDFARSEIAPIAGRLASPTRKTAVFPICLLIVWPGWLC